jgi:hypothetical protein
VTFETLIYTDCLPGQGLRGSAGLQFQARSAGADAEAMALVQRALLYEPPHLWMSERRPVADYPPSFGHAWDGYLATARGVYLGREANGAREGNQLTHAVVTRDPASYGLTRPAQLAGAPFWTTLPAGSTTCPPLADGWTPGPFDAAAAQRFVREHPRGPDLLATLVSTLERVLEPQGRRLLFIAEQTEPVLRWLTAATLLLPQSRALRIGFKVFTTNPAYAVQPVLAVHPDWGSCPAGVDNDLGYVVVDLVSDRWSQVRTSPTAAAWVELFDTEDPYDVVDAVEVAAACGLPTEPARRLALAVVAGRDPGGHDADLVAWLASGPPDLLAAYGGTLVDLLLAGSRPCAVLRELDRVTCTGRYPERAAPVRLALLSAEVAAAAPAAEVAAAAPATEPVAATLGEEPAPGLPAQEWDSTWGERARRVVLAALHTAEGKHFEAVLRVAARFGVPVAVTEVHDAAARFVADWLRHPDRSYHPERWPDRDLFVDLLRDQLAASGQVGPARAAQIGQLWWRQLLPYAENPADPVDAMVLATAMAESPPETRLRLAESHLRSTVDLAGLASALWLRAAPTAPELELLLRHAPPEAGIDGAFLDAFVAQPLRDEALTSAVVDLCRRCCERGLVREPGPETRRLLDGEARVRALCELLPDGEQPAEAFGDLAGVPTAVFRLHAEPLVAALQAARPSAVLRVLAVLPTPLVEAYAARLARRVRKERDQHAVATAFGMLQLGQRRWPAEVATGLTDVLRWWLRRGGEKAVQPVGYEIRQLGGQSWMLDWWLWAERERGGPLRRLRRR